RRADDPGRRRRDYHLIAGCPAARRTPPILGIDVMFKYKRSMVGNGSLHADRPASGGDPGADAGTASAPGRQPVTERGARTRSALVAAARVVFERAGYLNTRLTDITREAHCSTGTFYTYFAGKEEILAAVLDEAQEDMLHPGMARVADPDDPYA